MSEVMQIKSGSRPSKPKPYKREKGSFRRADEPTLAKLPAKEWKPMIEETFARVMAEFHPKHEGDPLAEANWREMGYITFLTIMFGNPEENPRRPILVASHGYDEMPDCGEH